MTRFRFQALVVPALAAGLLAAPLTALPLSDAHAQIGIGIGISVHIAPPVLPVYVQPPLPAPGYIFTPGYWAYGDAGYYWVPGTWVRPPSIGLLWTPAYWGWNNGVYVFNAGYWGPHVGFYGGINYGFGYGGVGFEGGVWRGGVFSYNAAVNNFGGVHVTNVYTKTVVNVTNTHVSFNGPGGVTAKPTPEEASYMHEQHVPPTSEQTQHFQAAAHNRALLASANGGHPAITATPRPGEFHAGAAAAPAHPALRPAAARPEGVPHPAAAMRGGTPPREAALRGPRPQPHPAAHVAPARAERRPEERK
jgi:hypothetical protein